jgi:hypothetical protein
MIELLNSNFHPLVTEKRTFPEAFFSLLQESVSVRIASGYISEEAIAELLRPFYHKLKIEMSVIVGMHYFEGFTKKQYESLLALSELLKKNNSGGVFLAKVSKYHGKVYSFGSKEKGFSAIIGSSNLTTINTAEKIYDTDILIQNEKINVEVERFLLELQSKYCCNIQEIDRNEITIIEPKNLFEDYLDVKKVTSTEKAKVISSLTSIAFDIEIKPEKKTHLNCFFGGGRLRPWYEANLIVPKETTDLPNYPRYVDFIVITDDGYKFKCVTNGDYAKNLRSVGDLQILGRWLKGRMENKNALKIGDLVTADTFKLYKRNKIRLTKTSIPDTWYMDFGVNE